MKKYIALVACLFLVACANFMNPTYTRPPANNKTMLNEVTIDKGFDEVWSALIEYSSKSFFSIKNFEKQSGLLTLFFGAGDPTKFVDCGEINSPGINFVGPYLNAIQNTGSAELEGVMNIFVKPLDSGHTSVTVNARYISNVKDGSLPRQTWSFDTSG